MRVVLDTNTVVSGLFWNGTPRRLLDAADLHEIELYASPPLLSELYRVLGYPKLSAKIAATGVDAATLIALYAHRVVVIEPAKIPPTVADDPDDDMVLACAAAAGADAIVSGDAHLLALGSFRDIPILTSAEMLARLNS